MRVNKKVVFFDFFGVICSEIAPVWLERHYSKEKAAVIKEEIFTRADIGELTQEDTYRKLSDITDVPYEQIEREWMELININDELVEYIRELQSDCRIYLLSNAIDSFLNHILDENNLTTLFDKIFISSQMKIIKPDVAFFEYVLKDLGVCADAAIMIDDNPNNVKGAQKAGIKAIQFKDNISAKAGIEEFLNS